MARSVAEIASVTPIALMAFIAAVPKPTKKQPYTPENYFANKSAEKSAKEFFIPEAKKELGIQDGKYLAWEYAKDTTTWNEFIEMKDAWNRRRFSMHDLDCLAKVYAKYPAQCAELIRMKNDNGVSNSYRFNNVEIIYLTPVYAKYPEKCKKYMDMKTSDGKQYMYDGLVICRRVKEEI